MLDRASEELLYPDASLDLRAYRRVVVLAPHPDDEIYGCGGLLRLLVEGGAAVRVIVLTDGCGGAPGKPGVIAQRISETRQAAKVIGYRELDFLAYADRSLSFCDELIESVGSRLKDDNPDLVIAPAITERHPDHQVTFLIAVEVLRRFLRRVSLACYEVSASLIPNAVVDISNVLSTKDQAMRCFASQEAQEPYRERIGALNTYRAYSLGPQCSAAEAYQIFSSEELKRDYVGLLQPVLYIRKKQGLALQPDDIPLVSVIIRSVDRSSLDEAIASVVAQTYPRIEIVVVDATGGSHRTLPTRIGTRQLRLIKSEAPRARPAAANVGLDAARGTELIFLDDDDFFYADHIQRLVLSRIKYPDHLASYAGVEVLDRSGNRLLTYDEPWDKEHLLLANFLPIHSVLFSREVLQQGCRFDEDLLILEDWDFWLNLSGVTSFRQVSGCSAVYRYSPTNSQHAQEYRKWREKVVNKWLQRLGTSPYEKACYWAATNYDQVTQLVTHLKSEQAALQNALADSQQNLEQMCVRDRLLTEAEERLHAMESTLNNAESENLFLKHQRDVLSQENRTLQEVLESPVRRLLLRLSRLLHIVGRHQRS